MITNKKKDTNVYWQRVFSRGKRPFTFAILAASSLCISNAQEVKKGTQFVPFTDFVSGIKAADVNQAIVSSSVKVKTPAGLDEMRQHLLSLYDGVNVAHSFVLGEKTVDCVPVNQQPSVRIPGLTAIASQPPSLASLGSADKATFSAPKQLPEGQTTDSFGNALGCEAGTIPVTRTTLDDISRFSSLREFLQKEPDGAGHVPLPGKIVPPATATYAHKYSFAYEYVNNLGDNTNINLWRPYVYTDIDEVFSLAQSWTIGIGGGTVQTAESGWQNFPGLYGTENSVPFIYFTADDYQTTGCYNLTCAGFVQVSNNIAFGAPWAGQYYSVANGTQYELPFQWYLYAGNWWLAYNGTWIGYYPGSVYRGGQLAYNSTLLEFGTESVGTTVWPQEGSGIWAAYGWEHSLYEREIWYRALTGSTYWASLTADQPSPACYSTAGPYYASNWGVYAYFGGPGGAGCQ